MVAIDTKRIQPTPCCAASRSTARIGRINPRTVTTRNMSLTGPQKAPAPPKNRASATPEITSAMSETTAEAPAAGYNCASESMADLVVVIGWSRHPNLTAYQSQSMLAGGSVAAYISPRTTRRTDVGDKGRDRALRHGADQERRVAGGHGAGDRQSRRRRAGDRSQSLPGSARPARRSRRHDPRRPGAAGQRDLRRARDPGRSRLATGPRTGRVLRSRTGMVVRPHG